MSGVTLKSRAYQDDGVALLEKGNHALFWEMGLGKTYAVLQIIPREPSLNIVMCPIAVSQSWRDEVKKWRPDIAVNSTIGLTSARRNATKDKAICQMRLRATILLINYEQAAETARWWKNHPEFRNGKFHILVADESSYIKNWRAQRTKGAMALRRYAGRAYALSGTPVLHGPMDLHSQMNFVDRDILPENIFAFRNKYVIMGGWEGKQIIGYKNLEKLAERLRSWAMSVKKEDVASDLPPKIYQTREVTLSPKERQAYNFIKKEALLGLPEGGVIPLANALAKLMKLMQASSGFYYVDVPAPGAEKFEKKWVVEYGESKRKAVYNLLEGELSGQPVIIWSVLRWEQKKLSNALVLKNLKVTSKYTEGSALGAAKKFLDGHADVLIASPQELAYGMNFQRASIEIFTSNNFRYGDREQAEARCHRIGQENPVTIIDLLCKDTIDYKVLKVLKDKSKLANLIMEELGVGVGVGVNKENFNNADIPF